MKYMLVLIILLSLMTDIRGSNKTYMKYVSAGPYEEYILYEGFNKFEDLMVDCCKTLNLGKLDDLLLVFIPSYPIMIDKSFEVIGKLIF